jgi:prefoldin subunit 5
MDENRQMTEKLARLLRQSEILRQQSELLAQTSAEIQAEIKALRAKARAGGIVPGE